MVAYYNEKVEKQLWVQLTEEERQKKAMRVSGLVASLKETKARNESARKKLKDEEGRLEGEIASESDAVETRRELRGVPCRWEYQLNGTKDSVARLIREDTGEEVESRLMSEEEFDEVRQLSLAGVGAGKQAVPTTIDDPTVPTADQLRSSLKRHHGVCERAAKDFDTSRRTFNRWLKLRSVDADEYRAGAEEADA
jgi:hypothetical protein